jgi:hypothetical protein
MHDMKMPFVFRNKNQVKLIQNYLIALIDMREKYSCPEV